jgi:hypothetical protein
MRASAAAASPADPQRSRARVVVGTAGHIDHGKTLLAKALTGIDCDRWAEEKARGITIDLGFAHLSEGDLQIEGLEREIYLRWLEERGVLTVRGELVALPGRRVELAPAVAGDDRLVARSG